MPGKQQQADKRPMLTYLGRGWETEMEQEKASETGMETTREKD
jgi:hypothetical protein